MTTTAPVTLSDATVRELNEKLDKVKIALMEKLDCAFFTTIALSLQHIWDPTCKTAYTNYRVIGWSPDFFNSLDNETRLFVEVHESCHVAYDHLGRQMDRDMRLWNIAADHAINLMLEERGFKMPDWVCKDKRFKGMGAEDIYNILVNEKVPPPPNQMEDLRPSDMTSDEQQRHVEDLIIRAATQATMQGQPGSIPGEIQLFLDKLFKPKLPFAQLLRRYMTELAKTDYTWKKPNRRFFPQHHLPSIEGRKVMDLDYYVDISGSVSDEQFMMFMSEIAGVMKMMKPNKIRIIQFDTEIQHIDTIRSFSDIAKLQFHGRGGTDIECIMNMIEEGNATLSMVFTDGGFNWRRNTAKKKILWLINDNPSWKPMFGSVLHFSTRDYVKA
jgi:predicted metal-dependent peptidase